MPALIFDLDGTLVDTVCAHVFAWQCAFAEAGMAIDGWRIHRRMGMSGGLFTRAAGRELGHDLSPQEAEALQSRHGELFAQLLPLRRPLPGLWNSCASFVPIRSCTVLPHPEADRRSTRRWTPWK